MVRNLLVPHSNSLNWFCSDPAAALNTPLAVYSEFHFYFPILIVCVCVSAVSLESMCQGSTTQVLCKRNGIIVTVMGLGAVDTLYLDTTVLNK